MLVYSRQPPLGAFLSRVCRPNDQPVPMPLDSFLTCGAFFDGVVFQITQDDVVQGLFSGRCISEYAPFGLSTCAVVRRHRWAPHWGLGCAHDL